MNELIDKINIFSIDTENAEKNYQLAIEYDVIGQTASAITYYMRAAELTDDKLLAYECLLKQANCFKRQGNRDHTVSVLYKHAMCLLPKRPEAYYLLSSMQINEYTFVDAYVALNLALTFVDEEHAPLRTDVGYPGKWGLLLSMSIVSWMWGKGDEARNILSTLWHQYRTQMDPGSIELLKQRMEICKMEIPKEQPGIVLLQDIGKSKEECEIEIQRKYVEACAVPSEINEHVPYLSELAKECSRITEIGTKTGKATLAFIYSDKPVISYDIEIDPETSSMFSVANKAGYQVELAKADVLDIEIDETDLLFVNAWSSYDQLKLGLERHAHKVKKYIAIHNTVTYGLIGQPSSSRGMMPAIYEFLTKNSNWNIKDHRTNNNGLTVLEKWN